MGHRLSFPVLRSRYFHPNPAPASWGAFAGTAELAEWTVMSRPFKIPQSVLVVIHTPALDVLLINRADAPNFWKSVTGAKDHEDESFTDTAIREVAEETAIDCALGTLRDWQLENIYDIYPRWQHRYAPGITRNTEHVFGLTVP